MLDWVHIRGCERNSWLSTLVNQDLITEKKAVTTYSSVGPSCQTTLVDTASAAKRAANTLEIRSAHGNDTLAISSQSCESIIEALPAKRDGRSSDNVFSIFWKSTTPYARRALWNNPVPEWLHNRH
jgi:hypothetical protein